MGSWIMLRVKKEGNKIDVLLSMRLNLGESTVDDFNIIQFCKMLTSFDLIEEAQIGMICKVQK